MISLSMQTVLSSDKVPPAAMPPGVGTGRTVMLEGSVRVIQVVDEEGKVVWPIVDPKCRLSFTPETSVIGTRPIPAIPFEGNESFNRRQAANLMGDAANLKVLTEQAEKFSASRRLEVQKEIEGTWIPNVPPVEIRRALRKAGFSPDRGRLDAWECVASRDGAKRWLAYGTHILKGISFPALATAYQTDADVGWEILRSVTSGKVEK